MQRSKSINNSRIERNNDINDIDLLSKKKDRHGKLIKSKELIEIEDNINNNISVMIEDNKREENEKEDDKKDDDKIEDDKKNDDKKKDGKKEDDKIEDKIENKGKDDKMELKKEKKEDDIKKDVVYVSRITKGAVYASINNINVQHAYILIIWRILEKENKNKLN